MATPEADLAFVKNVFFLSLSCSKEKSFFFLLSPKS
jgi:hypothetical protein